MMNIENTQECFVQLWLRLERTRLILKTAYKRFTVRNVLKLWFDGEATDDFIWEVCQLASLNDDDPIYGNDVLPPPRLYPRKHRELLRALVAVRSGIGTRKVHLSDLDCAYSVAFPTSTPLNVNKKKRSLVAAGNDDASL